MDRWEEKAGFNYFYDYRAAPTPSISPTAAIQRDAIVDLTSKMDKDGRLHWDVPAGEVDNSAAWVLTHRGRKPSRPAGGLGAGSGQAEPQIRRVLFSRLLRSA